jgi:hypothetical protein
VLVVGVVLGAVVTLIVQDRGAAEDDRDARRTQTAAVAPGGAGRDGTGNGSGNGADVGAPTKQVLLAWQVDPLPDGLVETVAAIGGVEQATAVRHATVGLVGLDGGREDVPVAGRAVVPLDLVAVDPIGYPAFVPADLAASFAGLGTREVILGRTSARLREADVGDAVALSPLDITVRPTITFVVTAVVDDEVIGGAEMAVTTTAGRELGLEHDRYLLVAHQGDRSAIEAGIRDVVDGAVRFRGPGETPFLRDGDAVLPQAIVKATFGEFAIGWDAAAGSVGVVQDPAWSAAHLVDADVPVLGRVRCHRAVVDDLRAAMAQIEREHLGYLIDPTPSSRACSYADLIERTGALSRGYWGIAVVLNSTKNPTGSGSVQDPRVVAILQEHGFTWGGHFLVPEPAYFEHVGSVTGAR